MRIGLIADTHIPREVKSLPPHVKEAFQGVDIILHAGDIYLLAVLDELEAVAPVLAARGNGDMALPQDPRVKESHVLDIDGLKLGLTHSIEYPEPPWRTLEKAMEAEFGGLVDIIVSGDTHVDLVAEYKGVLLVNPGSPALPHSLFELGTVGLLEIEGGRVRARIIQLRDIPLPFERDRVY
jgi:hypothetical protein